jgi:hypothetical protein
MSVNASSCAAHSVVKQAKNPRAAQDSPGSREFVNVAPVRPIKPPPRLANLVESAFDSLGFEFFRGFAQINTSESKSTFPELLFGALGVPDVARGFLVRRALFPRFAQAARG